MATANPFDLLVDDDNDDPSQLIAIQRQKIVSKKAPAPAAAQPAKPVAKLPSKPVPPAEAVRESKSEGVRGGGRGGGRGYGRRGGGGYNREFASNENSFGNSGFTGGKGVIEETDSRRTSERRGGYGGPRTGFRGGCRGGYGDGEEGDGDHTRRVVERHSGTGRGNEYKREGAGRGNWGTPTDEISQVTEEVANEGEKILGAEKPPGEEDSMDGNKEKPANEPEEKDPEDKEMTLEEYEKVLEEKRKALDALKTEERKVEIDKELASMQQLSNKKSSDDVFVKLGSDKDKRKEIAEKEERSKKSFNINEFLKLAEGERYYRPGGRGRGSRGEGSGSRGGSSYMEAPSIEDPRQFPTLSAR